MLNPVWTTHDAAADVVDDLVSRAVGCSPRCADLGQRMERDTATRISDWLDHIVVPARSGMETQWRDAGFVTTVSDHRGATVWQHPGGGLPLLVNDPGMTNAEILTISLAVDSVSDARRALGGDGEPEGDLLASFRRARLWHEAGVTVQVVERHGWRGITLPRPRDGDGVVRLREALRVRQRHETDVGEGFAALRQIIERGIADVGRDETCARFFSAERAYWLGRNRCAQQRKGRQDALGLGWANQDHHVYRSSRRQFPSAIAIFEQLGLERRERLHAGSEAGWGAQVLEHPITGLVVVVEADVTPDELAGGLVTVAGRGQLGVIGAWCALHGESLLDAGLHRLAVRCSHAVQDIPFIDPREGCWSMSASPPLLRHAITHAESWPIAESRLEYLLIQGVISTTQAAVLRQYGAPGSHVAGIEGRVGFKGIPFDTALWPDPLCT